MFIGMFPNHDFMDVKGRVEILQLLRFEKEYLLLHGALGGAQHPGHSSHPVSIVNLPSLTEASVAKYNTVTLRLAEHGDRHGPQVSL